MARRYDHSKDELRQLILSAASDLIIHNGLDKLSTRKIAENIGYSVGVLYQYYPSLADIVMLVNRSTLEQLEEELKVVPVDLPAAEKLLAYGAVYASFAQRNVFLWRAIFEYSTPQEYTISDEYLAVIERLIQLIEVPFQSLVQDKDEAQDLTRLLWMSVHSICSLYVGKKLNLVSNKSLEELIEHTVKIHTNTF